MLFLSVLTLGEIRKGIAMLPGSSRRARLEAWFETGLRARFSGCILAIDEAVSDATALHHNLTLVTRDDAAVAGCGVPTLNPWI